MSISLFARRKCPSIAQRIAPQFDQLFDTVKTVRNRNGSSRRHESSLCCLQRKGELNRDPEWSILLTSAMVQERKEVRHLGGPCSPPLTTTFLAPRRMDFIVGPRWLRYHGKPGAVARRTFLLGRIGGWLFHLNLSMPALSGHHTGVQLGDIKRKPLSPDSALPVTRARSKRCSQYSGRRNKAAE